MKKQIFRVDSDGFNGAWYPAPVKSGRGLLISFMFKAGKEHKKECRETRIDIDKRLKRTFVEW